MSDLVPNADAGTVDGELLEGQVRQRVHGFPIETLPEPVKRFVIECAMSMPVPNDLVAIPVLVSLGAAIGNARRIVVKKGWVESAGLYGAVIADTGSMKSPALARATAPIRKAQSGTRRTWTSDTTVEKLGVLLQANRRGIMMVRDELLGLVRSLNQYRSGKGADREFYLSAFSGAAFVVDRKGADGPVQVARPFLAIVGCLPPDRLGELAGSSGDGFIERMLFAWPDAVRPRWTDTVVSPEAEEGYSGLVNALLDLQWAIDDPEVLSLSSEAQAEFQAWHDRHMSEMNAVVMPGLRGFYAKLKGYCPRLALIHALASDPTAKVVGLESVWAAERQIEYFKTQAAMVADQVCRYVGTHGGQVEQCKGSIRRKVMRHGGTTRREAQRNQSYLSDVFNEAWESLCQPELVKGADDRYRFRLAIGTDIPTLGVNPKKCLAVPAEQAGSTAVCGPDARPQDQLVPEKETVLVQH